MESKQSFSLLKLMGWCSRLKEYHPENYYISGRCIGVSQQYLLGVSLVHSKYAVVTDLFR